MDDWEIVRVIGSLMPEEFGWFHATLLAIVLFSYSKWGNYNRLIKRFEYYEGYRKVQDLLTMNDEVNPLRLFEHIGMTRSEFIALSEKLRLSGKVRDGSSVMVEEKVMLFLSVAKGGFQFRAGSL